MLAFHQAQRHQDKQERLIKDVGLFHLGTLLGHLEIRLNRKSLGNIWYRKKVMESDSERLRIGLVQILGLGILHALVKI